MMTNEQQVCDLLLEWDEARADGRDLSAEELCSDCPELLVEVQRGISELMNTDWMFEPDDDGVQDDDCLSLPPTLLTQCDETITSAISMDEFAITLVRLGLIVEQELSAVETGVPEESRPQSAVGLAQALVRQKKLTEYQATMLLEGKSEDLVLGDYVILDKLGEGGMGEVFKARHRPMDRIVAIKILTRGLLKSKEAVQRFAREAQTAAKLEHPNIVIAYDAGEFNGTHFLVMQYVQGQDLHSLIRDQGPLDVDRAMDCIAQAAKGLAYAHAKGIIHRDIKPSNLILDPDGTVKVLDMGLARLRPHHEAASPGGPLTNDGIVMGTADYMPPEQANDTRQADERADVYALGCTLHFLLLGRAPFGGANLLDRVIAHRDRPVPSLCASGCGASEDVDAVFCKMMAKQPGDRYQTMSEVIEALDACVVTADTKTDVDAQGRSQQVRSRQQAAAQLTPTVSMAAPDQDTSPDDRTLETQLRPGAQPSRRRTPLLVAVALAFVPVVALASTIVIKITNKDGTTKEFAVEVDSVDEIEKIEISTAEHSEKAGKAGPSDAGPQPAAKRRAADRASDADRRLVSPADAPFDERRAGEYQEAWASYLDVPVQFTNSLGMKFRLVPPGTFLMGSNSDEINQLQSEVTNKQVSVHSALYFSRGFQRELGPSHVAITRPFYLCEHEVTQQQYEAVMEDNPSRSSKADGSPDDISFERHPVDSVPWIDALRFCEQLSRREQLKSCYRIKSLKERKKVSKANGYRLPTSAEWEFACRAGTQTRYWCGDTVDRLLEVAWVAENSGRRTHAVAQLQANPFGLYDMHGNVSEWCEDSHETYSGRAADPITPFNMNSRKISRGGPFSRAGLESRAASVFTGNQPSPGSLVTGFRVALEVEAVRSGVHAAAEKSQ